MSRKSTSSRSKKQAARKNANAGKKLGTIYGKPLSERKQQEHTAYDFIFANSGKCTEESVVSKTGISAGVVRHVIAWEQSKGRLTVAKNGRLTVTGQPSFRKQDNGQRYGEPVKKTAAKKTGKRSKRAA